MRRIDADALKDDILVARVRIVEENNQAYNFATIMLDGFVKAVDECDTVGPIKHDLISDPDDLPKNEKSVLIKAKFSEDCYIYVIGFYEDGTTDSDNSAFDWTDVEDQMMVYDEKMQVFRVPKGWYEQSMYMGEYGVGYIDDQIMAWWDLGGIDT